MRTVKEYVSNLKIIKRKHPLQKVRYDMDFGCRKNNENKEVNELETTEEA